MGKSLTVLGGSFSLAGLGVTVCWAKGEFEDTCEPNDGSLAADRARQKNNKIIKKRRLCCNFIIGKINALRRIAGARPRGAVPAAWVRCTRIQDQWKDGQ